MALINNVSFRVKIIVLCVFLCGVSAVIGAISYLGLESVEASVSQITDKSMPKLQYANEMFLDYRRIRINLRTLGMSGLSKNDELEAIKAVTESMEAYEKADQSYTAIGFNEGQKELYDQMNSNWKVFKSIGERLLALNKSGKPEDRHAMEKIFFNDCPEAAKAYTADIGKLLEFHKKTAQHRTDEIKSTSSRVNTSILLFSCLGVLVGLSAGILFSTAVSKTVMAVANSLDANSDSLASASTQIAASAQELSQAAVEQAASLQETSAAVEELSAMVAKNAESSKNAALSSSQSQDKANEGKEAVEQMMTSMEEINSSNESIMNQINRSNQQMAEIVTVIQEIGNKTKIINDIVFQTKLLSFNASVEAARAGEHGKGFAVVAEEVGNLAQMSGNAAKEISDMLEGSIKKVETIVRETKTQVEILVAQGKSKVGTGIDVAKRCGDVLNEIVSNVNHVSSLAGDISNASQEQSQGISEINTAVTQLDQVTQQNANATAQTASAAEQLSTQAEQLKAAVALLMKTMSGNDSGSSAAKWKDSPKSRPQQQENKVVPLKSKVVAPKKAESFAKSAVGESFPLTSDPGFTDDSES